MDANQRECLGKGMVGHGNANLKSHIFKDATKDHPELKAWGPDFRTEERKGNEEETLAGGH